MESKVSKVAVIGCSDEGYEIVKEIIGKLNLGKKSSIILIPHIKAKSIYNYLKEKRKKVYPILNDQIIEPQSIYVGMENPTDLSEPNYYGLRRKLKIKKYKGEHRFSLGEKEVDYLNKAFCAVADKFKDKCIGVILYGIGDSGVEGTNKIKKVGGKVLVQALPYNKNYDKHSMPYAVINNCEVDYILSPDKLLNKLEEMLQ